MLDGVDPDAFLSDVLTGWRRAQLAQNFSADTVRRRVASVMRMGDFAGSYPWQWTAADADDFFGHPSKIARCTPAGLRQRDETQVSEAHPVLIARPAAGLLDRHVQPAPLCATYMGGRKPRPGVVWSRPGAWYAVAWYAVRSTDRTLAITMRSTCNGNNIFRVARNQTAGASQRNASLNV